METDRRMFFKTALGAAGLMATLDPLKILAADAPAGSGATSSGTSGLLTGKIKEPLYAEIPGLFSKDQVEPHVKAHYGGALKSYLEVEDSISKMLAGTLTVDKRAYRELQQEKVGKANSVLLHEFYFDTVAPKPPDPVADVRKAIAGRFGTLERWVDDFQESAKAAQGWAMLVHHPVSGKLYNVILDAHEVGPMVLGVPLAVIDVYEHAFYVDYKNKKADYIANFVKFLDWAEISKRYRVAIQ